jgi:hypothetical protein
MRKAGGSSGAIATTIPRFERRSVEKVAIAGGTVRKIKDGEKRGRRSPRTKLESLAIAI